MCGIFGFIQAGAGKGPTLANLKEMAVAAESRGRHAFGVSWIDAEGRLHCYKQAGRISQHLDVLNLCVGAKAVIGHTRWATHGSIDDNTNNHPHPVDGGWLVHNGIVTNYAELIRDHRLLPQSRCDSEVLGLLIERFKGSLLKRVRRTIEAVASDAPLAMAALWNRPGRVVLVRRGNPVFVGKGRTGNVYFCSCPDGLPGTVKAMDDNTVFQYDLQSGSCQTKPVAERRVLQGKTYEGSNTFSEGAGRGQNRAPSWLDDLEPCGASCGNAVDLDDIDDDEVEIEDTQTMSLFDEANPDPNDPAAVTEAIRASERKQEDAARKWKQNEAALKKWEQENDTPALTTHQQKATNLLAGRIDPVARLKEYKEHGTMGGRKVDVRKAVNLVKHSKK
jgi:hypothetical protein